MQDFQDGGAPERKFLGGGKLSLGAVAGDARGIEGYASVFGQVDQGGDMVLPGAYRAALAQRLGPGAGPGRRVRMLWQHDPAQPIGVWDEIREDATGLFVRGRLLTEVAQGREAAALLAAGAIEGLSIGYRTVKAAKDSAGVRRLAEVDLWEVSLVTFPMQAEARAGMLAEAKGAPGGLAPQGWQQMAAVIRGATADWRVDWRENRRGDRGAEGRPG